MFACNGCDAMGRIEVTERLMQMAADASQSASVKVTAIARQMTASGMLVSGNFYASEKEALQSIYDDTLQKMEAYSLSVLAPGAAANAVRVAGQELEAQMLKLFEGVLKGEASGNPCPPKASEVLLPDFRRFLRERLLRAVSDARNNVLGKPVRGWQGWLARYGWNAINTLIAALALYWSWVKK
jgi:hypothetical protein